MCIDFTDLNKACPKDNFPLPRIDTLVDQAAGSEMLSFLDCFSGYHQIWMRKEDEEFTSFITPFGTYCFVRASLSVCQINLSSIYFWQNRKNCAPIVWHPTWQILATWQISPLHAHICALSASAHRSCIQLHVHI
jgi:hypothetical protein